MKILGFTLIIFSCLICGYSFAERKNERLKELASLCMMLELMKNELENRLSPLPEMMNNIIGRLEGSGSAFLKSVVLLMPLLGEKDFSEIWAESCEKSLSFLEDNERKIFCALSAVLGKYDVQRQCSAIDECLVSFRDSLNREKLAYPQLRSVYMGTSLSAGALIAILLI